MSLIITNFKGYYRDCHGQCDSKALIKEDHKTGHRFILKNYEVVRYGLALNVQAYQNNNLSLIKGKSKLFDSVIDTVEWLNIKKD